MSCFRVKRNLVTTRSVVGLSTGPARCFAGTGTAWNDIDAAVTNRLATTLYSEDGPPNIAPINETITGREMRKTMLAGAVIATIFMTSLGQSQAASPPNILVIGTDLEPTDA